MSLSSSSLVPTPTSQDCPLIPAAAPTGLKSRSALTSPLTYRITNEKEELTEAFKLIYNSYLRAGLAEPNSKQVRLTPFHLLSTTEVLVTRYEDKIVSTVSLIGDGELGLPLESIYPGEVAEIRANGLRMAEIGCLADRRESPVRFIETFATMGRMLAQAAKVRGYDGLVAAAHPKHARLYKRILPFDQVGGVVDCPYANGNPAVMVGLVFDDHRGTNLYDRFFGSMASGLDVQQKPWADSTREHFKGFAETDPQPRDCEIERKLSRFVTSGQYPTRVDPCSQDPL